MICPKCNTKIARDQKVRSDPYGQTCHLDCLPEGAIQPDHWWHSDNTWIDMSEVCSARIRKDDRPVCLILRLRDSRDADFLYYADAESFWQAWLKYREGGGA